MRPPATTNLRCPHHFLTLLKRFSTMTLLCSFGAYLSFPIHPTLSVNHQPYAQAILSHAHSRDAGILCHGVRRFGGHCLQLCQGKPTPHQH